MTQTRTYQIEVTITVDDEDADLLSITDKRYATGAMQKHATMSVINNVTLKSMIGMHRIILARQGVYYDKGFVADHTDGDNGNNRRKNLRVVTSRQNRLTSSSGADKQSMYLGVSWSEPRNKWIASVSWRHMGKGFAKYLGGYDHEQDAAKAYDAYLIEKHIKKPLNFPVEV